MTSPMIVNFTCSAGEDLFTNTTIKDQISKHFGSDTLNSILKGNAGMVITVFPETETKIKFSSDDNWQDFILKKVYSSSGIIYPKHCYIKDAITGTLSIQVQ